MTSLTETVKSLLETIATKVLEKYSGAIIAAGVSLLSGAIAGGLGGFNIGFGTGVDSAMKPAYAEWEQGVLQIRPNKKASEALLKWPKQIKHFSNLDTVIFVEDGSLEPAYPENTVLYGTPCTIPMRVFEKGDASKKKIQYLIGFWKTDKDRFALAEKADNKKEGWHYHALNKGYAKQFKTTSIPLNTVIHSCFKVLGTDTTST
jgi:hypothetical protein